MLPVDRREDCEVHQQERLRHGGYQGSRLLPERIKVMRTSIACLETCGSSCPRGALLRSALCLDQEWAALMQSNVLVILMAGIGTTWRLRIFGSARAS